MLDYDITGSEYDEDDGTLSYEEVREYLDNVDGIAHSFDDNDNLIVHTKPSYSSNAVFPGFGVVLEDEDWHEQWIDDAITSVRKQKEEFEAFLNEYAIKKGYGLWLIFAFGHGYNYIRPYTFESLHDNVRELVAFDELEVAKLCGATELCEDVVDIEDVDLRVDGMSTLVEKVKEDFNRHCKENITEVEAKIKKIEESIKEGAEYEPVGARELFYNYLSLSNWDDDYDGFWDNYNPDERTVTVDYSATIFTEDDGAYDICYLKHTFKLPDGLTVEDDT